MGLGTWHSLPSHYYDTPLELWLSSQETVFGKTFYFLLKCHYKEHSASWKGENIRFLHNICLVVLFNMQKESASITPLISFQTQCPFHWAVELSITQDIASLHLILLFSMLVSQWFISDFGCSVKTSFQEVPHLAKLFSLYASLNFLPLVAFFFVLTCLDYFMVMFLLGHCLFDEENQANPTVVLP